MKLRPSEPPPNSWAKSSSGGSHAPWEHEKELDTKTSGYKRPRHVFKLLLAPFRTRARALALHLTLSCELQTCFQELETLHAIFYLVKTSRRLGVCPLFVCQSVAQRQPVHLAKRPVSTHPHSHNKPFQSTIEAPAWNHCTTVATSCIKARAQ